LSPIPGLATWFVKQSEDKIKKILKNYDIKQLMFLKEKDDITFNQYKIEQNKDALKKLVYYYLTEEKDNKKPANGVAYFHLNNGASIYDIVINGNLSLNGYKESFGIMVNYYYELEKIVKNHEDFVNKGKISIMGNLKEYV
jgi:malonyl-CoA decarboxylase